MSIRKKKNPTVFYYLKIGTQNGEFVFEPSGGINVLKNLNIVIKDGRTILVKIPVL